MQAVAEAALPQAFLQKWQQGFRLAPARLQIDDELDFHCAATNRAANLGKLSLVEPATAKPVLWARAATGKDEARCHRSILRELLVKMGAKVA